MQVANRRGSRRVLAGFITTLVLSCFVAACFHDSLIGPTETRTLCPGGLYCGSSVVPQGVRGGTCCVVVDLDNNGRLVPNAQIGYLCAFGSDRNPAGCMLTLAQARFICPTAPSIVRCTAE